MCVCVGGCYVLFCNGVIHKRKQLLPLQRHGRRWSCACPAPFPPLSYLFPSCSQFPAEEPPEAQPQIVQDSDGMVKGPSRSPGSQTSCLTPETILEQLLPSHPRNRAATSWLTSAVRGPPC